VKAKTTTRNVIAPKARNARALQRNLNWGHHDAMKNSR